MTLPIWKQGALRPSPLITWTRKNPGQSDDGHPENLSGATLTGNLRLGGQDTPQAIAGMLTITDAANGVFRWDLAAGDVAVAGTHSVEFTATYGSGQTPAKTFSTPWKVEKAL